MNSDEIRKRATEIADKAIGPVQSSQWFNRDQCEAMRSEALVAIRDEIIALAIPADAKNAEHIEVENCFLLEDDPPDQHGKPIACTQCWNALSEQLSRTCRYYTNEIAASAAIRRRVEELEDLLVSARAIAQRKGADTAWERFDERLAKSGIGCVTAKVFKVLLSDREQ